MAISPRRAAWLLMPRDFLEQIALDVLKRNVPGVAAVSIDDPREHPDYVPSEH